MSENPNEVTNEDFVVHGAEEPIMHVLSKITTVLCHPLLMPAYCTLITLFGNSPYAHGFSLPAFTFIIVLMGLVGCLCPLMIIGIYMFTGHIKELEMNSRQERVLPCITIGALMMVALFVVPRHMLPAPLVGMLWGEASMLVFAGLCSLRWKVSLHTLGTGGLLAYVVFTGLIFQADFCWLAALAFVAAGLSAWTRLYERAHTSAQLLMGYVVGFAAMWCSMFMIVGHIL